MPVLADVIRATTVAHRDRVALVDVADGSRLTFGELTSSFYRVGHTLLDLGLHPGDHVAIYQRNSRYWVALEGALATLGAVTVPVNRYLSKPEVLWMLDHSEARAVAFSADEDDTIAEIRRETSSCEWFLRVAADEGVPHGWASTFGESSWSVDDSDPMIPVQPGAPQRIMYTSATTGRPKGVICPNEVMVGCIVSALANQLKDTSESDRLLVTTPLTHVANNFFWAFYARGGTTIVMPQFSPEAFCRAVRQHEVTHTFLVPTMIVTLLEHARQDEDALRTLRDGSLRAVWYAGSPIPVPVALEAEELLGPILNQQYGMTELYSTHPSMAVTALPANWHARKAGSCGRPLVGSTVRVVDESADPVPPGAIGEILVRCNDRVAGYWKKPPEDPGALHDGWIHTNDLGRFDDEGFLYILDRKNDMIISGGLNVYPAEVESVLCEHPGVHQCAVVGVPHPTWLEVPCAVVVRRPGHEEMAEAELIDFARQRLAGFKAPKQVLFREALPVTATGKVLRRKLRDEIGEALALEG